MRKCHDSRFAIDFMRDTSIICEGAALNSRENEKARKEREENHAANGFTRTVDCEVELVLILFDL